MELAIISKGRASEEYDDGWLPEWDHDERPCEQEWYYFYHALCLEWRDGFAERRGLARIPALVWQDLVEQDVEILLR